MSLDPDLAPLVTQFSVLVDQEGAALNPHEFSAVQRLFADDIELATQFFIRIREQIERKFVLGFEFFVGSEAVSGCAENYRILPLEFSVKITKVLAFGGASGCRILGVKIENDFLTPKVLEADSFVAGRYTLKVFNNAI